MPRTPRSDPGGAAKSARQKWEEAASHRDPSEADSPGTGGEAARAAHGPVPTPAGADAAAPFLHTRDGAFYPTGHAVLGLAPEDASALAAALERAGVSRADMMLLAPEEAAAVMRETDEDAGMLARMVGAEIRNARVMRQLAESGTAFLIVRVDDDEQERRLVTEARRWPVHKALRYHALAVEELRVGTEAVPGESPYGVNEVLRSKPTDARLEPRDDSTEPRRRN